MGGAQTPPRQQPTLSSWPSLAASMESLAAVFSDNEWSTLRKVVVGRASHSCFPSEPRRMIEATMPVQHWDAFGPKRRFPQHIVAAADAELDAFAAFLEQEGVVVYRPAIVDWYARDGYTGAMPRDGILVVGNHIIEALFAWGCRRQEIELAYGQILRDLDNNPPVRVIRAPMLPPDGRLYGEPYGMWAINDQRAAFDAADFMRFGRVLIGQFSHVTNAKGVAYVRQNLPPGYSVEMLDVDDEHAMHIDATILPLREGLLVYNAERVTESALRKVSVLREWDLRPVPIAPRENQDPPSFMCSGWLFLNALVLDGKRVVVDEVDVHFAAWLRELGMEPIACSFRHVNSLGGAFHCATADLLRSN